MTYNVFSGTLNPTHFTSVAAQKMVKHRPKFGWPPVSDIAEVKKEAKTRNPLKFAGVPQTPEPISAVSGPKFTMLWGHM